MKTKPCPWCYNYDKLTVIKDCAIFIKPIWTDKPTENIYHTFNVYCEKCGCRGPNAESKEKAIEKWNRRNI